MYAINTSSQWAIAPWTDESIHRIMLVGSLTERLEEQQKLSLGWGELPLARIVLCAISSNVSYVEVFTHALVTSDRSHDVSAVSSIIRQFSISHYVGTLDVNSTVIPDISNGMLKSLPMIPNSRVLSVGSSDITNPKCRIWFGLSRLIDNFLPYHRTGLNQSIDVLPVCSSWVKNHHFYWIQ